MDASARTRLDRVLTAAGLPERAPMLRLASHSNEVWRVGGFVVRVSKEGHRSRMLAEADVLAALPSDLPVPRLVTAGGDESLAWTVTEWVDGLPLADAWDHLTTRQTNAAIVEFAEIIARLHDWTPPAGLLPREQEPTPADSFRITLAAINPLPVPRVLTLAEQVRRRPFVDGALIDAAVDRLRELQPLDLDAADPANVPVHGDAHLGNVVWHDGRVRALIDFEWLRPGPRQLELEPMLRSVDWSGRDPESIPRADMARILDRYATGYPRLFQDEHLVRRLWLHQIAYAVRELAIWPIDGPADGLAPDHPLNRLPLFLRGTDHLLDVLD